MLLRSFMWIALLVLIITKEIASCVSEYELWSDCPYPLNLWFCISIISLSVVIILCICLLKLHASRGLNYIQCLICLPVLQVFNLIISILGTVWLILTLNINPNCVIYNQIPISTVSLILEGVLVYIYWIFASGAIITLISVVLVQNFDYFGFSQGGLSYREIEKISTTVCDDHNYCSICLENIEPGTVIKVLPECFHKFHPSCVEPWLLQHNVCPYCRQEINITNLE